MQCLKTKDAMTLFVDNIESRGVSKHDGYADNGPRFS